MGSECSSAAEHLVSMRKDLAPVLSANTTAKDATINLKRKPVSMALKQRFVLSKSPGLHWETGFCFIFSFFSLWVTAQAKSLTNYV